MSRYWHIAPIVVLALVGGFMFFWTPTEFFGTRKDGINTTGALFTLLATCATFIEVIRSGATVAAVSANRSVSGLQERATKIQRTIQEIRTALELLDQGQKMGGATGSNIGGQVAGLLPSGTKIDGKKLPFHQARIMALIGSPTAANRTQGIVSLGSIRSFLEIEAVNVQKELDLYVTWSKR